MNVKIEERNPRTSEYSYLRTKVGWDDKEKETSEKALNNSIYSVVAIYDENVVGMGRIIGDGGIYYYIQDLIVLPGYQNKGIGTRIMDALIKFLNENASSGSFVGLMSAPGYTKFYETFGFEVRHSSAPGMFKIIKHT